MNLTEDKPKEGTKLTELGRIILTGDPYLEDIFTIWLLHCQIVKNYALATAWGLFFDSFSYEEFSRKQMNDEMTELAADYTDGEKFSEKSVEDDCDAILRMYVKRKEKQMNPSNNTPVMNFPLRSFLYFHRLSPDTKLPYILIRKPCPPAPVQAVLP